MKAAVFAIVPAVLYASFVVAGIFVGQIQIDQYGTPSALIKPGECGFVTNTNAQNSQTGLSHVGINVSTAALQYARSCYGGQGSASAISCSVYPVPTLNYTVKLNQPCPLPGGDACFTSDDGKPITLVTKVMDSHYDLGINAPTEERLTLQYRTTCAPLAYDFVDQYLKVHNCSTYGSAGVGKAAIEEFYVGSWRQNDFETPYLWSYAPIIRFWGIDVVGYAVNAFQSLSPHASSLGWTPVAPFNKTPADLSLFFLTPNAITYTQPVTDPMFRTYKVPDPHLLGGSPYVPERDVYLMACGEQWQICNPNHGHCTGWNTTASLATHFERWRDTLALTSAQAATYKRLALVPVNSNIFSAVNGVPDPLLAAAYLVSPTGSQPVGTTHWRAEVEGWFAAALAKIQYLETVFVHVPPAIVAANDIAVVPPTTHEGRAQCSNQRVAAPQGYQSYNFFALVFVAFFGLLVPGIALAIRVWHDDKKKADHAYKSFQAEDLFALHRLVMGEAEDDDDDDEEEEEIQKGVSGDGTGERKLNEGGNGSARSKSGYQSVSKSDGG